MSDSSRAALYLRISKDDAQTGLAVERQREDCLKVIEREGLTLVETYTDNAVSAYARNVRRPEFDRMTGDFESGRFAVVVCWDMDRFSRQPAQLERWIELGESRGLRILTPTEVTDLGTDNGRMFARMKATIARAEVERKSARQKAQTAQAKANGTFKSRVGFSDPVVIARIFASVLAGKGPYEIAAELNAEGLKTLTGLSWSGQAVRRVAMTPRHRGTLIGVADYDAVQALLAGKTKVGAKEKGRYSGVARCSTCDSAMTASGPKYVCAFATNHPGEKGHQSIARKVLDNALDIALTKRLLSVNFRFDGDPVGGSLQAVNEKVASLTATKDDLLSGLKDGLTMADLRPTLAPVLRDLEAAMKYRERLLGDSIQAGILDGIVSDTLGEGGARLAMMDPGKAYGVVLLRVTTLDSEKRRRLAKGILKVRIVSGRGVERIES